MPTTVRQQDGDTYWIEVKVCVCVCVCVLERDEREHHPYFFFFYLPLFFVLIFSYYNWVMIHVKATDAMFLKAHL